ncbi:MAG: hypothetical protein HY331_12850 [Chloroflexi bacterium]|nr:hypothetical protein [Chloroflexota bacterium]
MLRKSRVAIISAIIGVLWLLGCSSPAPAVDKKGESVSIKGPEGQQAVVSKQLPPEFAGWPAPQGFAPGGSVSVSARGQQGAAASWVGKGTTAAVVDFYKRTLTQQGWKEEFAMDSGTGSQLGFSKGEESALIIADKQGDDVTVSVILSKSGRPAAAVPTAPGAAAVPTVARPTAPAAAAPTAATPTPEPPALADASALPAEMKDLPVPAGFAVEKGTTQRLTTGTTFQGATATWVGKGTVKDVAAFYRQALPAKGWQEQAFLESEENATLAFDSSDGSLHLGIIINKDDDGTRAMVSLTK